MPIPYRAWQSSNAGQRRMHPACWAPFRSKVSTTPPSPSHQRLIQNHKKPLPKEPPLRDVRPSDWAAGALCACHGRHRGSLRNRRHETNHLGKAVAAAILATLNAPLAGDTSI